MYMYNFNAGNIKRPQVTAAVQSAQQQGVSESASIAGFISVPAEKDDGEVEEPVSE